MCQWLICSFDGIELLNLISFVCKFHTRARLCDFYLKNTLPFDRLLTLYSFRTSGFAQLNCVFFLNSRLPLLCQRLVYMISTFFEFLVLVKTV